MMTVCEWRGAFANDELNALHAEAFGHAVLAEDWWGQLNRHSLGWVCLRRTSRLIGFVNIAWDGGVHAFLLDTMVAKDERRQGHAERMVRFAAERTKEAGCEWLHVDFEPHLRSFYLEACGFRPTEAGLIALK
ncbi:MAG TPA: GNAT family N-acetyltransferase [Rhizomicrobium sp.]|nr:GNAT family N-acetyltransferase [Rhizomicrobium sp.]